MRAIGLDVGTKTIGVAGSDPLGMLAHPLTTVARRGLRVDIPEILAIARAREARIAVIGLPLELEGDEKRSARLARQVGAALAAQSDLEVLFVDERFTSVQAERQLIAAGASRKRRKAVIDQAAAVLILQAWIDHGAAVVHNHSATTQGGQDGA